MTAPRSHPSAAAVIDLYRRTASLWNEVREDRGIERTWLERFAALLPPGASVLDIGCGTGCPIAQALSARGLEITGVDAAPEMVALFRRRLPSAEALVADMRGLDLGRQFHGLVAWDSFFHLAIADQREMFAVLRRHAAPGSALMFTSGPEAGESIGVWQGEPLHHASLDPAEYCRLLDAHGFDVADFIANDPDCGGHTVWLARARADVAA